jgi:hypothetical protein
MEPFVVVGVRLAGTSPEATGSALGSWEGSTGRLVTAQSSSGIAGLDQRITMRVREIARRVIR